MQPEPKYSLGLEKIALSLEKAKGSKRYLSCAVTSVGRGEGVSSVSFELGRFLAEKRKKTVVALDCTGRGDLKRLLDVREEIAGKTTGLHRTSVDRLYFFEPVGRNSVSADYRKPESAGLLSEEADYLIVDAPHIAEDSFLDTVGAVDGILLVLDLAMTVRDEAKTAVEKMKQAGVTVIGAILNRRYLR